MTCVFIFVGFMISCTNNKLADTIHPVESAFPPEELVAFDLSMADTLLRNNRLGSFVSKIKNASLIQSIGMDYGDSLYMFGNIKDIVVDSQGRIAVLDDRLSRVTLYDSLGNVTSSFGSQGSGPEEFLEPTAIVVTRNDTYIVTDKFRHIKTISDQHTAFDTVPIDYEPYDMCASDEIIYIVGGSLDDSSEGPIKMYPEINSKGVAIGSKYSLGNVLVQLEMSKGMISCGQNIEGLSWSPRYIPYIYFMDSFGSVQNIIKLVDFYPRRFIETVTQQGKTGMKTDDDVEFIDFLQKTTDAPGGFLIVQIFRAVPEGKIMRSDVGLHTYIIDSQTNEGSYLGRDYGYIHFVNENHFYSSKDSPFPQVEVYEMEHK